ncbi:hypothetical protein B0T22DRAFT_453850 [Podospora appendiculata]|uniref:Uncharacterized protein n=1 Tax=Podospora appendiculata TaxID=314037 RepID=A0AAE0XL05_9PEZI|nr:hypothetical protein B0T22DRAFT_453850 [Podospora appendiculata]
MRPSFRLFFFPSRILELPRSSFLFLLFFLPPSLLFPRVSPPRLVLADRSMMHYSSRFELWLFSPFLFLVPVSFFSLLARPSCCVRARMRRCVAGSDVALSRSLNLDSMDGNYRYERVLFTPSSTFPHLGCLIQVVGRRWWLIAPPGTVNAIRVTHACVGTNPV